MKVVKLSFNPHNLRVNITLEGKICKRSTFKTSSRLNKKGNNAILAL